jgi:hypothetical protein
MLRWVVNFVVRSTLRVVQNRAVGPITAVEFNSTTVMFHLFGHLCTFEENDARNHEPNILRKLI